MRNKATDTTASAITRIFTRLSLIDGASTLLIENSIEPATTLSSSCKAKNPKRRGPLIFNSRASAIFPLVIPVKLWDNPHV